MKTVDRLLRNAEAHNVYRNILAGRILLTRKHKRWRATVDMGYGSTAEVEADTAEEIIAALAEVLRGDEG